MKKMFSLRLPIELREKLEKVAKEEDRSITNVIIRILKEYFK
ncbi:MAG: Arc family DNA-binding protein [Clostridiales bacterium]|nr:Arc family DNA-binding protein [Clostridiales bacterium]